MVFFSSFHKVRRAFTLIELLVVIAIISLLATLVITSVEQALAKTRDARRLSNLVEIKKALDLYYQDNGYYPTTAGNVCSNTPNSGWSNSVQCDQNRQWIGNTPTSPAPLSPYLPQEPVDPINQLNFPRGAYFYYAQGYGNTAPSGGSSWYMLVMGLEVFPNAAEATYLTSTTTSGTVFQYGTGSNGILTTGGAH